MTELNSYVVAAVSAVALLVHTAAKQVQHYPQWWLDQARCIHLHESTNWKQVTDWLGHYSSQHGGYQIDLGTWASFAPKSFPRDPASATPAQQTFVAWRIWNANGRVWGYGRLGAQWPNTSRECGLR